MTANNASATIASANGFVLIGDLGFFRAMILIVSDAAMGMRPMVVTKRYEKTQAERKARAGKKATTIMMRSVRSA